MCLEGSRALCLAPEEVEHCLLERAAAAEAASAATGRALDALTPLERCAWTEPNAFALPHATTHGCAGVV